MLHGLKDVRVAWVSDCHHTNSVKFTTSGTQLNVVSIEVMNVSSCKHGIVLELSLSEGRTVVGDDDKLGLTLSQHLQGLFVS